MRTRAPMEKTTNRIIRMIVKFSGDEEPRCWRCNKKALYRCESCGAPFCCRECFARDWKIGTHTEEVCGWLHRGYDLYARAMSKLGMLDTEEESRHVGEPNGRPQVPRDEPPEPMPPPLSPGSPPASPEPFPAAAPAPSRKSLDARRIILRRLKRIHEGQQALATARILIGKYMVVSHGALDREPDDTEEAQMLSESARERLHTKMLSAIKKHIDVNVRPTIAVAPVYDPAADKSDIERAESELTAWVEGEKAKKRWLYTFDVIQPLREFTDRERQLFEDAIYAVKYVQPCFRFPNISPAKLVEFALFFGKISPEMVDYYLQMVREDDVARGNVAEESIVFSGLRIPRTTTNFFDDNDISAAAAQARLANISSARYCMVAHYYGYRRGDEPHHHWSAFVFSMRPKSDGRFECLVYDSAAHIYPTLTTLQDIGAAYGRVIMAAVKYWAPPIGLAEIRAKYHILVMALEARGFTYKIIAEPMWFQWDTSSCGVYACDVIRRTSQRDFAAARLNEAAVRKKMTMEFLRGSLLSKRKR